MTSKRIFITGGCGYLGQHIIKRYYDDNQITVFSRDEMKQAFLRVQYPKINFVIGDVRNLELLRKSSLGHDIGIFCASLKHVGFVNQNVEESVRIIIDGAINSRTVALENGFEAACMVNTDKSRLPVTLYGAMKFIAGEQFIWGTDGMSTRMSTAVCGNIINSSGSVIPMIWEAIRLKKVLPLHSEKMTRFIITGGQAADLVDYALTTSACNIVPKLQSIGIKDLFEIYRERFGLQYTEDYSPTGVEREHECMISKEDMPRADRVGDYFRVHYRSISNGAAVGPYDQYCSRDFCMNKEELDTYLKRFRYFQP